MYLTKDSCFWDDDTHYAMYKEGERLFDCLRFDFEHGGGYIGFFLCKFISFKLPLMLKINPADFISWGGGFFRGLFTVLTLLCMTNLLFIPKKLKFTSISFFIFLFSYFLYSAYVKDSFVLLVNYAFYRYFFSLLFFSIFIGYFYKNIIYKRQINFPELFTASLCGYIVGTSSEILFIAGFLFFLLINLYNIIITLIEKIKKEKLNIYKYKLNIYFYVPYIINFIAIYLFTTSLGFKKVAEMRTRYFLPNFSLEYVKDFLHWYFKIYFQDEILIWLLLIGLIIVLLAVKYKKSHLKKIIFPIILIISIAASLLSLVITDNPNPGSIFPYFLNSTNIIFLIKMLYIIPLTILFGQIINKFKLKFSSLILIIIIAAIFFILDIKLISTNHLKKDLINIRKQNYITQKITTFYKQTFYWEDNINIFNGCPLDIENNKVIFINEGCVSPYFYKKVYNIDLKTISVEKDLNIINKYIKDGGTLTDEELKHIKFSRINDTLN